MASHPQATDPSPRNETRIYLNGLEVKACPFPPLGLRGMWVVKMKLADRRFWPSIYQGSHFGHICLTHSHVLHLAQVEPSGEPARDFSGSRHCCIGDCLNMLALPNDSFPLKSTTLMRKQPCADVFFLRGPLLWRSSPFRM